MKCENKFNSYLLCTDGDHLKIYSIMNNNRYFINNEKFKKKYYYYSNYTINNMLSYIPSAFKIHINNNTIIINNYITEDLFYKWSINFDNIKSFRNIDIIIRNKRSIAKSNITYLLNQNPTKINNFFQDFFKYKSTHIITNNSIRQYLAMLKYCDLDKFIYNMEKLLKNYRQLTKQNILKQYINEIEKLENENIQNHNNFIFNKFGCYVNQNSIVKSCKIGCYPVQLKYIIIYLKSLKDFF
jgi:hypothetical protein